VVGGIVEFYIKCRGLGITIPRRDFSLANIALPAYAALLYQRLLVPS
jgi:hypothetical protein